MVQSSPMAKMQDNKIRVPPQSMESEKAVLGSLMVRPGAIIDIAETLASDAFYSTRHKLIFQAMLDLASKNQPIDLVSVTNLLSERKELDNIGGASYLSELVASVPSATNAMHYASIVSKKYILRELIDAADYVSDLGFSESDDTIEDIMDTAEKRIFSITSSPKGQKFVSIRQTLSTAWERIEKLHETKGGLRGVPTGFKDLDTMLSGLQNSDLIILAARPSMGKTALALDIARMAATRENIPVGIFSLEMSAQQLVDRMLASESRVDAWNLRTGKLSADSEFSNLRDALDKLSKAPIYIDDQAGNSIMRMRATARRLKSEHGLGLIIIDYLQLMTTSKNYDSMVNQVTEISRSLKGLARDLDVPVLALSQLSRAVESRGGKPRLSDLRDSGSIEQDADVVMFIHREDKYKDQSERTNLAEILIEKHRNGPTGKVDLYFDDKTGSYLPIEKGDLGGFKPPQKPRQADDADMF